MRASQATLDRIRKLNKRVTNKLLIRVCGRDFGHFAVLEHVGRKTGTHYRIPVIAEPLAGGFVIAMTYGKKVDWYRNIIAHGGCSLLWKRKEYTLASPQFISEQTALVAFPSLLRPVLRRAGIEYFLKLAIQV